MGHAFVGYLCAVAPVPAWSVAGPTDQASARTAASPAQAAICPSSLFALKVAGICPILQETSSSGPATKCIDMVFGRAPARPTKYEPTSKILSAERKLFFSRELFSPCCCLSSSCCLVCVYCMRWWFVHEETKHHARDLVSILSVRMFCVCVCVCVCV